MGDLGTPEKLVAGPTPATLLDHLDSLSGHLGQVLLPAPRGRDETRDARTAPSSERSTQTGPHSGDFGPERAIGFSAFDAMKELGRSQGAKTVVIEGARRTTGAGNQRGAVRAPGKWWSSDAASSG